MGFLDTMVDVITTIKKDRADLSDLISEFKQTLKRGDIEAAVDQFRKKGHEDIFSSWISRGENRKITAEQVHEIFGPDELKKMAQRTGLTVEDVTKQISKLLPDIVDKITPNGRIED